MLHVAQAATTVWIASLARVDRRAASRPVFVSGALRRVDYAESSAAMISFFKHLARLR